MDVFEMEAKLDMLEKRLEEAQKERQKTEQRFKKCERYILRKQFNIINVVYPSEIAELEGVKVEDDRQTAQLNKMVENLESTLDSYKRDFF